MAKNSKGPEFERECCRDLSVWASKGKYDDWYWRSSQSGGRATTRAKTGRRTIGQNSDVAATCSEAEFLTKECAIEIKRGYNRTALLTDLLDRSIWPGSDERKSTILGFLEQTIRSARTGGNTYWMLIHKRDKRLPLVYMPKSLSDLFLKTTNRIIHHMTMQIELMDGIREVRIHRLVDMLTRFSPDVLKRKKRKDDVE